MPELVAHDVGALAGKDRASGARTMEELQALAVIKGVEVDAEIEVHGEDRAHFPLYPRHQCSPEIGAAPQCFSGSPVPKLRSSRRMRLGLRSRGRVHNSDRQGLIAQNGDRPLDDLASARLSTGAGIVLPSVDHALRLCPALRRCRTCLAPALASYSRRLRCAFRSLPCHVISPVAGYSTCTCLLHQPPMRTALALSLVQWPYRGALDYVSSTIRRRHSHLRTLRRCIVVSASRRCSGGAP